MKNNTVKYIIIVILVFTMFLVSCNQPNKVEGFALGTFYSIKTDRGIDAKAIQSILDSIEESLSVNLAESDIYRINNSEVNEWVEVSLSTVKLIEDAFAYAELDDANNAFNAAIFPLVRLWGFAPLCIDINERELPDSADINELLPYASINYFEIDGNRVRRLDERAALDLGGIAKGYAADVVAAYLADSKVKSGLINLGGNLISYGKDSVIGIAPPRESNFLYIASFTLPKGQACATSGDYERFYYIDDTRYHHIIGKDGYPVNNDLMSATIICGSGMDADALSTIAFVEGSEKAADIIRDSGAKGILVTQDKTIIAIDIEVIVKDNSYTLIKG